ncbi:MFS transporter [Streptomyces justiciae]|uniref:MFS transporter n=1 Tax=Streptomyces justiciae TaxID=2780140 RepID=UPI002118BE89|nr:MFS transporter [Streptomyces justiciae]MCW8384633.1 MFS transporter [Streptomyces justiciae]
MNIPTLLDRLGFPDTRNRKRLVVIAVVDSLGTGMFLPLTVVYFVTVAHMGISEVGLALSIGAIIALLGGPYTGTLIDRYGPGRIAVLSCTLRGLGFVTYMGVDSIWQLVIVSAIVRWADNAFWPANSAMVIALCGREQRARWYTLGRTVRSIGLGVGAALSGVLVAYGSSGARTVVLVNAATFFIVTAILVTWREAFAAATATEPAKPGAEKKQQTGMRALLADRAFLLVVLANTLFAVTTLSLAVLLPLYAESRTPADHWLPGVLFALNSSFLIIGQPFMVRYIEKTGEMRVMQTASLLWALSFAAFLGASVLDSLALIAAFFIAVALFSAAELIHAPTGVIVVTNLAQPSLLGRYLSMNQMSWSVGNVITPAMLTALFSADDRLPWGALVIFCAASSGLLLAASQPLAERKAAVAPEASEAKA